MPVMSAAERDAWLSSSLSAPVVETKNSAPAAKEPETPTPEGEDAGAEVEPSTTEESTDQTDSGDVSSDDNADPSTATGEADTETETDDADEPAVEPTPPPKRGTAAARIQDLIEENKSLRAFGEHVLTELKTRPAPAAAKEEPTPVPPAAVDEPAPTLESCGFDADKFSKELTAYTKKIARAEALAEISTQSAQRDAEAAQAKFYERADEFSKTKPDYKVVMSNKNLPGMDNKAAETIVRAEEGPAIAYYLAKNPDQATRLSRMTPAQQLVRVGELKILVKETASAPAPKVVPKAKKLTQAPPPPTPTPAGSSTAKPSMLDNSLSMNDWVARDRAEKAAAKQARIKMRDSMRR